MEPPEPALECTFASRHFLEQPRSIGALLLIYGAGGVLLPFIGIKAIDLVVHNVFGA